MVLQIQLMLKAFSYRYCTETFTFRSLELDLSFMSKLPTIFKKNWYSFFTDLKPAPKLNEVVLDSETRTSKFLRPGYWLIQDVANLVKSSIFNQSFLLIVYLFVVKCLNRQNINSRIILCCVLYFLQYLGNISHFL